MTDNADVTWNAAESRYELHQGGQLAALVEARPAGDAVMLTHTETQRGFEGQGHATRLVQGALDTLRAEGRTVVPMCSFVAAFMQRHPEYAELVTPEQRGVFGL